MVAILAIILLVLAMSKNKVDSITTPELTVIYDKYYAFASTYGQNFGVPVDIIMAIIMVESGGNPAAMGSANDIGLMQITPIALKDVNAYLGTTYEHSQLIAPGLNIYCGAAFLKIQYVRAGSNWDMAIRAYNVGFQGAKNGNGFSYLDNVASWMKKIKSFNYVPQN